MKLKNNFDFKSLRFRLWCCFLIGSLGILVLVWGLQIALLRSSYETMKVNQVTTAAAAISHTYSTNIDELTDEIAELSVESDMYVMMESNDALLLFTPEQDSVMPVYKYRNEIPRLKTMIEQSELDTASFKFSTNFEEYETLAYCKRIESTDDSSTYLYIFTPLYPVSSTVTILKNQLIIVTFIVIIIAFFLALYLSKRITKPLSEITYNAKKMGEGNYDVTFYTDYPYTEMNRLSKTLNKATVELGRADNLQKDMIANVSHDLKTPITLIKSYAEMIRDLSGDNKEKRDTHLNVIIKESERMTGLISDMSQFSKMQNKKIELNEGEFDLSLITAELLESYKILEENEGYSFTFNAPQSSPVYGDEAKIKQVISNLVGNAIKYCGDNKDITINIEKDGKFYRFEVVDHGQGISEEDLEHVWDRYYRTSENFNRPETGTGLGLSIVKQILTLHNANFGAESELGKGSTFWFEIRAFKK